MILTHLTLRQISFFLKLMLTNLLRDDPEFMEIMKVFLILCCLFPNLMHSFILFSSLRSVRKIGVISKVKHISEIARGASRMLIWNHRYHHTNTNTRLMIHTDTDTDTAYTDKIPVSVWDRYQYQVLSHIMHLVSVSVQYRY